MKTASMQTVTLRESRERGYSSKDFWDVHTETGCLHEDRPVKRKSSNMTFPVAVAPLSALKNKQMELSKNKKRRSGEPTARRVRNPSAIYDLGDGKCLFVPSELLWIWNEQAKTLGSGSTMSDVWRAVQKAAKAFPTVRRGSCASTGPVYEFVTKNKEKHSWVEDWVLRGQDAPSNVTVATRDQVRWVTTVWDFRAHCEKVGLYSSNTSYCRWVNNRRVVPNARMLAWFYDDDAPAGIFIVDLRLQRLRRERTFSAICKVAGTTEAHWRGLVRWSFRNDKAQIKSLLTHLIQGRPASEHPAWPKLSPKAMQYSKAISDAAKIGNCLERANLSSADYYKFKDLAQQLGVTKQFDDYLGLSIPLSAGPPNYGMIAPNFFVPTPEMIAFRQSAHDERVRLAKENRNPNVHRLSGYLQWMWSWTVPPSRKGSPRETPRQASQVNGAENKNGQSLVGSEVHIYNPHNISFHGVHGRKRSIQKRVKRQGRVANHQQLKVEESARQPPGNSKTNGPVGPDGFQMQGKHYDGFSALEFRLLECLFNKEAVTIDDVIESVYGHDSGQKERAVISLKKHLNSKLQSKSFPGEIRQKSGFFSLAIFGPK